VQIPNSSLQARGQADGRHWLDHTFEQQQQQQQHRLDRFIRAAVKGRVHTPRPSKNRTYVKREREEREKEEALPAVPSPRPATKKGIRLKGLRSSSSGSSRSKQASQSKRLRGKVAGRDFSSSLDTTTLLVVAVAVVTGQCDSSPTTCSRTIPPPPRGKDFHCRFHLWNRSGSWTAPSSMQATTPRMSSSR
jgi:plasmid stabilization system protein ParE